MMKTKKHKAAWCLIVFLTSHRRLTVPSKKAAARLVAFYASILAKTLQETNAIFASHSARYFSLS